MTCMYAHDGAQLTSLRNKVSCGTNRRADLTAVQALRHLRAPISLIRARAPGRCWFCSGGGQLGGAGNCHCHSICVRARPVRNQDRQHPEGRRQQGCR